MIFRAGLELNWMSKLLTTPMERAWPGDLEKGIFSASDVQLFASSAASELIVANEAVPLGVLASVLVLEHSVDGLVLMADARCEGQRRVSIPFVVGVGPWRQPCEVQRWSRDPHEGAHAHCLGPFDAGHSTRVQELELPELVNHVVPISLVVFVVVPVRVADLVGARGVPQQAEESQGWVALLDARHQVVEVVEVVLVQRQGAQLCVEAELGRVAKLVVIQHQLTKLYKMFDALYGSQPVVAQVQAVSGECVRVHQPIGYCTAVMAYARDVAVTVRFEDRRAVAGAPMRERRRHSPTTDFGCCYRSCGSTSAT